MDVVKMFGPVTKWAISILHPDTIAEIIRKAVRLARTEKPGAVHIELPEDVAKMETGTVPLKPNRFRRSVPDDQVVDKAFDVIKNAKRPIILAGNGCIRKRASKQLRQFCEQTGIGVISTFMAKGSVDMDADYCLYTIGLGTILSSGTERRNRIGLSGRGLLGHTWTRGHKSHYRRGRLEHGPGTHAGAHGPRLIATTSQGVTPNHGRGKNVRAGDKMGNECPASQYNCRDYSQGRAACPNRKYPP